MINYTIIANVSIDSCPIYAPPTSLMFFFSSLRELAKIFFEGGDEIDVAHTSRQCFKGVDCVSSFRIAVVIYDDRRSFPSLVPPLLLRPGGIFFWLTPKVVLSRIMRVQVSRGSRTRQWKSSIIASDDA